MPMPDTRRGQRTLKLADLSEAESTLLTTKLRAARAAIPHAGEKGRSLEHEARLFLRSFLPEQYGLATGFVAYHARDGVKLSKQLDLIIFDAVRGSPLVTLSTCDVFPLEHVFGYVEVKAHIKSGSKGASTLEQILRDNAEIRKMRERRFWYVSGGGSPAQTEPIPERWLALRAYVFAFEASASLRPASRLAQTLANVARKVGDAHIHGVYSPDSGFAYMRAVDPLTTKPVDWHHVYATRLYGSLAFKSKMLKDLVSFPRPDERYLPSMEEYFDFVPVIEKFIPDIVKVTD
jgi:hypothetical protein